MTTYNHSSQSLAARFRGATRAAAIALLAFSFGASISGCGGGGDEPNDTTQEVQVPTGIQITGSSGTVQIDQDFRNFVLYSKATVSINTAIGTQRYEGSTSIPTDRPYFAAIKANGEWVATDVVDAGTLKLISKVSTTATVYVFAPATTGSTTTTAGLLIYDGSGKLVYDSGKSYMRIASADTVADLDVSNSDSVTGLPSGSYAVIATHTRHKMTYPFQPGLGYMFTLFRDFYKTNSTGWEVSNILYLSVPTGPTPGSYSPADYLVNSGQQVLTVDVSGL